MTDVNHAWPSSLWLRGLPRIHSAFIPGRIPTRSNAGVAEGAAFGRGHAMVDTTLRESAALTMAGRR
eukprot:4357845-Pleurochrysis_carterae.AAC.3